VNAPLDGVLSSYMMFYCNRFGDGSSLAV